MKLKGIFFPGIIIALIFLNACSTEAKDEYYYCEEFWITTAYFKSVPYPSTEGKLPILSYRNDLRSHMIRYIGYRSKVTQDVIYNELERFGYSPTEANLLISKINKLGNLVVSILASNDPNYTLVMYIEKL